ncbi:hypothetical protein RJ640_008713, partial [Escallonia rubra]
ELGAEGSQNKLKLKGKPDIFKKEDKKKLKKEKKKIDEYIETQIVNLSESDKSVGEKKIIRSKNMKNDKIIEVGMGDDLDEQNEAEGKESNKSRKK